MNRVVLIGRLVRDPELRYTQGSGTAVATITLAVDRRFSKDGQREADFIRVVIFNKQAESVANYMSKGRLVAVSGRIQVSSYEDKNGVKRYSTDVIADEVQFLESKNSAQRTENTYGNGAPQDTGSSDDMTPVDEGDIPF